MSLEIITKFEYNGVEYEFDARDADDAEKLEMALEGLSAAEKAAPKDGKSSSTIRAHCKMLKEFFDTCLGEGAGDAICTEKSNIIICYDAYDKFLGMIKTQKDSIVNAKNTFAKYSNRQQRRAAEKKNGSKHSS